MFTTLKQLVMKTVEIGKKVKINSFVGKLNASGVYASFQQRPDVVLA